MSRDPYFTEGYLLASAKIEGGVPETYRFEDDNGFVEHRYIRRAVESSDGRSLYDIITPYGYGGPLLSADVTGENRKALVSNFMQEFQTHCAETDVVSEFVRFHPFDTEPSDFAQFYETRRDRITVFTDLRGEDVHAREFSKSARKKFRRNERLGIDVRLSQPDDLTRFVELYVETMERNRSADFYLFDDEYFSALIDGMAPNLLLAEAFLGERLIGAALCLVGGRRVHVHLSATDNEYLSASPANSIRFAIADWALEMGYETIHHGGGRTRSETDSLFRFKAAFGSGRAEFWTGRKVWNPEAYAWLCDKNGEKIKTDFFPAYRAMKT